MPDPARGDPPHPLPGGSLRLPPFLLRGKGAPPDGGRYPPAGVYPVHGLQQPEGGDGHGGAGASFPAGASFSLLVDNTQVLLRELEAGRLDFVLVEGFFDHSRYEAQLYRREEFFGVCAPHHRLAGRAVPLDELAGERLILRESGSGTRAIFEEALHRQNWTLRSFPNVVTISDFSTIKSLAADGLGVSFLYAPVVAQELKAGTLARFDLAEVPMSGAFYFVCLKDNLFAKAWVDWMQ